MVSAESLGDVADVKAKVDIAIDGDIVQIPAGICKWTTNLSITKAIMLQGAGTERTAVRFAIDGSGTVTDVNSREKSLLQTLRNPRRNAG